MSSSSLEMKYDWSDLDVGNMNLDDSENFFSKRHSKHEAQPLDAERYRTGTRDLEMELEQQRRLIIVKNAQAHAAALAKHLMKATDAGWASRLLKDTECPPPQAYGFKDIYEQKKQQLLRNCVEQERKLREFRSRPMPNFERAHQQQLTKPVIHRITCPITPNVLKTSRASELKRRQKIEELLRQREEEELNLHKMRPKVRPIPKFMPPLQPLKTPRQSQLEIKPFNFSTEQRAQQRKIFNAQALLAMEDKRKQLEEQRRRREWAEFQKQRQLATFKARPNPFKGPLFMEVAATPKSA